ncbi:MAG TPA: endonuclease MutS2 [Fimbriimonadaceae bacterium]|nr:endonuclease MutS2 [Fimbriimonadaceae bacterium]
MDHALRVLEYPQVRTRLARQCETPIGESLALELEPSMDSAVVSTLLDETREAHELIARHSVPSLGRVRDFRDALRRIGKGGMGNGEELFAIADAMSVMREVKSLIKPLQSDFSRLWKFVEWLPEHPRLEESIFDSLEPNGDVKDSAAPQLAAIRQKKRSLTSKILETIQGYTTGSRRDLLSDPIYTIRDGRYVIPLKAENKGKIKGIVHDTSASGQTVYLEPEDVLQLGNRLREAESAEREEIEKILWSLSGKVAGVADEVIPAIERTAELDLVLAKARLAYDMKATAPRPAEAHSMEIQRGRHPLLDPETAVPLDLAVGGRHGNVLITGPNTGGKTVAIKCVGLFAAMLQAGMFVPATDVRFGPFTQIWADIGDEQSLQQSLSTFSGHVKNIAEALKSLQFGSLVLLDEVGAGTDPAEGAALARSILMEMHAKGAVILASTHYGELKAFAYSTPGFTNAAMEFDAKSMRPTYRLILGAPGASHALRIAERYGIPKSVVDGAKEGLGQQHLDLAAMLEELDTAQKRARKAQSEADRRSAELKSREEQAARKLSEADAIRRNANQQAKGLIEEALRQIRLEAAEIFEELKGAGTDQKVAERARTRLKELQSVGQDFANEFQAKPAKPSTTPNTELKAGMSIKIEGYPQIGVLLSDPSSGKAQVQIGPLKMTVKTSQLVPVAPTESVQKPRANLGLQRAQSAATEIHLRGTRAEDAMDELDRFLDDAVLAGLPSVRIVHGKGEGILRGLTRERLRANRNVKSFREGEPGEGGAGVTVAVFK